MDNVVVERLPPRQKEVAELIAEGLSNAEIARRMNICIGTVRRHTNEIYNTVGMPINEDYAEGFPYHQRVLLAHMVWEREHES